MFDSPANSQRQRRPGVGGGQPAGGPVGVGGQPQQPSPNPGFQDARPAGQVIANPVQGYDYSRHPEFATIRQGLQQRPGQQPPQQAPAAGAHPFAGVLAASAIGVTGAQAPEAGGVGVSNAYAPQPQPQPGQQAPPTNLPERGRAYPADQEFDFPAGWGHGYVESGGMRRYTYSTPEEQRAGRERAEAYRARQWEGERQGMIRDLHGSMMALVHGTGPNSLLPFEQRASMAQALGEQLGGLIQSDTQGRVGELQFGDDPRRNPEYVAAQVAAMQAEAQANLADADPSRRLELLRQINADPSLRALFLATQGADGATIASIPAPVQPGDPAAFGTQPQGRPGVRGGADPPGGVAVNAGNYDTWLGQEGNKAVATVLGDPDTSFGRKATLMAQMPGFRDPNSPARQAWDTFVHREFPTRQAWQEHVEGYPAMAPEDWRVGGVQVPLTETVFGPLQALKGWMFGVPTGTQWGWGERYRERNDLFDMMDSTGWSY